MDVISVIPMIDNKFHLNIDPGTTDIDDMKFEFTMALNMNVTVTNINYYDLTVKKVNLKAFVEANIEKINSKKQSPTEEAFGRTNRNKIFISESNNVQKLGFGSYENLDLPSKVPVNFLMKFTALHKSYLIPNLVRTRVF